MNTSAFVQDNLKAIGPENKPQPAVTESFLVTVKSPDCKCAVTACGDLENGCRRVIPVRKCNHSHDAQMAELALIAKKRMESLIEDVAGGKRLRAVATGQTVEPICAPEESSSMWGVPAERA